MTYPKVVEQMQKIVAEAKAKNVLVGIRKELEHIRRLASAEG